MPDGQTASTCGCTVLNSARSSLVFRRWSSACIPKTPPIRLCIHPDHPCSAAPLLIVADQPCPPTAGTHAIQDMTNSWHQIPALPASLPLSLNISQLSQLSPVFLSSSVPCLSALGPWPPSLDSLTSRLQHGCCLCPAVRVAGLTPALTVDAVDTGMCLLWVNMRVVHAF